MRERLQQAPRTLRRVLSYKQPGRTSVADDSDFGSPLAVEPLYELLRAPKRRASFEGGHMPPAEIAVPLATAFLDETLGPVARK